MYFRRCGKGACARIKTRCGRASPDVMAGVCTPSLTRSVQCDNRPVYFFPCFPFCPRRARMGPALGGSWQCAALVLCVWSAAVAPDHGLDSDSSACLSSMLRHPDFTLESGPSSDGDTGGWGELPPRARVGTCAAAPCPHPAASPGVPLPRAWTATAGHRSAIVPVPEHSASLVARFLHRQPWRQSLCRANEQARTQWLTELCRLLPQPERGRKYSRRPLLRCFPRMGGVRIDLYRLYHEVCAGGGLVLLTRRREMSRLARLLGVRPGYTGAGHFLRTIYVRLVYDIERAELRHPARRRLLASQPCSSLRTSKTVSRPDESNCDAWGRGMGAEEPKGGRQEGGVGHGSGSGRGAEEKAGGEDADAWERSLRCPPPAVWSNVCARCRSRRATVGVAMVGYREQVWGSKLCKACSGYLRALLLLRGLQHPEVMAFLAAPAAGCTPKGAAKGAASSTTLADAMPRDRKAVTRTLYASYEEEQASALARRQRMREEVAAKAGKRPTVRSATWRAGRAQWLAGKLLSLSRRCHLCRRRLRPGQRCLNDSAARVGQAAGAHVQEGWDSGGRTGGEQEVVSEGAVAGTVAGTFPGADDGGMLVPPARGARPAKEGVCVELGREHVCATHSWAVGLLAAPASVGTQGGGRKSCRSVRHARGGLRSGSSAAGCMGAVVDKGRPPGRACPWCEVRI